MRTFKMMIRTLALLTLTSCGQADQPSSISSSNQNLADRSCRVVLRSAEFTGCVRSTCFLNLAIDVRRDVPLTALKVLVRTAGASNFSILENLVPDSSLSGARYARFRSDGSRPHAFAVPANPVEIMPVAETATVSWFDHNHVRGDFDNYRVDGASAYLAAAGLCE